MREIIVYAPAKLNLYLDVLDKRPDGYHNIKTLFEKIDLTDEIIIREKGRDVEVKAEPHICPSGKDNIVYKAVRALFREAGVDLGLEITIKKQIPVSAGLGGGSSDAASVVAALNDIYNMGVPLERLFYISAEIGKDCPFFMLDAPFAVGTGTGELLEPIDTDWRLWHVIIRPDIPVSTAEMYKMFDGYGRSQRRHNIEEIVSALKKKDTALLKKGYFNVFEELKTEHDSFIERARVLFSKAGAGDSFLSGSGPSVFCIFNNRREAMQILERIPKGESWDIFLATTFKGGHLWK